VGVRMTRNVVGEYLYTGYDILEEREFEDTVAYIVPLFLGAPYRCLVPKEVDNLLISGRCISTTPGQTSSGPTLGAYNDMKSIPTVMTYGEAAGTAAALCVKHGVSPRGLDSRLLQDTLGKHGALLNRDTIDRIIDELRLPNGIPFRRYRQERLEELRKHWEKKGCRFFDARGEQRV
jgi:hypothetical protein